MSNSLYYAGIDGGGSHCRLRLEDDKGNVLGCAKSGPANVMRSIETTIESITQALNSAITQYGKPIPFANIVLCAGCAGANIPSARSAFLRHSHPFQAVYLTGDLHAACAGAHNGNDGAVLVCGTGSSSTRFSNGKFTDFGGHGFPIGDKGSGAWLGFKAIQHTLLAFDSLAPQDSLFDLTCTHFNANKSHEIVQHCANMQASDYAKIAPKIIALYQQQQVTATRLVHNGLGYLEGLIEATIENSNMNICLIGGLSTFYQPLFKPSIQSRIAPANLSPEQGAILLAKQSIQESSL